VIVTILLRIRNNARLAVLVVLPWVLVLASLATQGQGRVIELVADKDSRYKMEGKDKPSITVKAGEAVVLRITARRGKSWNRDGSIHGFSLLRAKDRSKVSGWDLLLKPGKQEFQLTAPAEPGDYEVVCTVICSEDHEGMHMKFVVEPSEIPQ
jgi:heme/copper-type cytochrome/quinol oxidase subunit 2